MTKPILPEIEIESVTEYIIKNDHDINKESLNDLPLSSGIGVYEYDYTKKKTKKKKGK
jgi:hypothetical protein